MTDLHPCPDLDAYFDGELSDADARAVDAHVTSCASCTDQLAIAQRLADEFATLRDEACPPDLVATAIAAAKRHAPERAPAPRPARRFGRLNRWVLACAVLAVGAVGLSRLATDRQPAPASGELAEVRPDPAPRPSPPPRVETPAPRTDPPVAERGRQPVPPASARSTPQPTPRPEPLPTTDPVSASEPPLASAPTPEEAAPDAGEIEQAQADLLLALSLVADAQDHARSNVSHQLERAADALHDTPIF